VMSTIALDLTQILKRHRISESIIHIICLNSDSAK
jgi:hypothetical protein